MQKLIDFCRSDESVPRTRDKAGVIDEERERERVSWKWIRRFEMRVWGSFVETSAVVTVWESFCVERESLERDDLGTEESRRDNTDEGSGGLGFSAVAFCPLSTVLQGRFGDSMILKWQIWNCKIVNKQKRVWKANLKRRIRSLSWL